MIVISGASSIANACTLHPGTSPNLEFFATMVPSVKGQDLMSDDLSAEFEIYRRTLPTEGDKQAFDRKIKRLLEERGVDYVRGYVDALKEAILR
jgi:hypothetical protein